MVWMSVGFLLLALWLVLMCIPVHSETISFTKNGEQNITHCVRKTWRFGTQQRMSEETITELHKKEFSGK
jgi:hypothetical protein